MCLLHVETAPKSEVKTSLASKYSKTPQIRTNSIGSNQGGGGGVRIRGDLI